LAISNLNNWFMLSILYFRNNGASFCLSCYPSINLKHLFCNTYNWDIARAARCEFLCFYSEVFLADESKFSLFCK